MPRNDGPVCASCGKPMTPQNARQRPELFLHDACLPDSLKKPVAKPATIDHNNPADALADAVDKVLAYCHAADPYELSIDLSLVDALEESLAAYRASPEDPWLPEPTAASGTWWALLPDGTTRIVRLDYYFRHPDSWPGAKWAPAVPPSTPIS